MKEIVLIPNRGVIALDIINSLNSIGLETAVMYSPEDSLSLPVKLADRSYKFYSSKLEDSYLDMDAIIEKALEIKARFIHPGYGFLSESPEFASRCQQNGIHFIGPQAETLALVQDKLKLRRVAEEIGVPSLPHSDIIKSALDFESISGALKYPAIIKPVKGSGGRNIRVADYKKEAHEQIDTLLKRDELVRQGLFVEEFLPCAFHIEIPFIRDCKGNMLLLPEIESSIQRRFQKVLQESPSINLSDKMRAQLFQNTCVLLNKINYVGYGSCEYLVYDRAYYFSEINPTTQINTTIPEIHLFANMIKKQFHISQGELLHHVSGCESVKPKHHVLLISLMAEDPIANFQPSSGVVSDFFHYATIRNLFKTTLYTGARISPMYDPFIGKILSFAVKRQNAISDMQKFLDNIIIRGIRTNLVFLKHLLACEALEKGDTVIDFLNLKFDFSKRKKSDEELHVAAALLGAAFHMDNRRKNYKARLEKMKQPGLLKRLFGNF